MTNKTAIELLPCPFCGNEPEHQHFNVSLHLPGRIICACGAEMRQGRNQTSAELVEAWNFRADSTCIIVMNGPLGTCSLCGDECFGDSHAARYCPNCGAKVVEHD